MFTRAAQSLLKLVELKVGNVPEQLVQSSTASGTEQEYNVAEVEKLLIGAMPDCAAQISALAQDCGRIQCAGDKDAAGVSLLEARVKTNDKVANVTSPTPIRVDPYEVVFKMPHKTSFVLFFNGRQVDVEGRPAIMGIAAREGQDSGKLDQSYFYRPPETIVQTQSVKKSADFARFKEENAPEFRAGDPVIAVALDSDGRFISSETLTRPLNEHTIETYPGKNSGGRWVPDLDKAPIRVATTTGEVLDRQPVVHYVGTRVALEVKLTKPSFSPQNWLNEKLDPALIDATLMAKRGLMFEPGATAQLTFPGASIDLKVEGRDMEVAALPVRLPGSPTRAAKISIAQNGTLLQFMMQQAQLSAWASPDRRDVSQPHIHFEDLVMPYLQKGTLGGVSLGQLKNGTLASDIHYESAEQAALAGAAITRRPANEKERITAGSEKTQRIDINLVAGYFTLAAHSLKGFQAEIGLFDGKTWQPLERRKLSEGSQSEPLHFSTLVAHPAELERAGGRFEIRYYSPEGLPIKRSLLALDRTVPWAEEIFS